MAINEPKTRMAYGAVRPSWQVTGRLNKSSH